ncbi:MAG: dihydroorotase [Granulosicoccus sp.]
MEITLTRPDDWHLHLRDGEMLRAVITASAEHFGRALIMPNLVPPVVTAQDALRYRQRILEAQSAMNARSEFAPMMTLYLTEDTQADDVVEAAASGTILAVKLYPAGATTNSASGVHNLSRVMPVLEAMAAHDIVLCVHGEVTTAEVDIFDREARFIETVLEPLRQALPELRVVMEHVTTSQGVDYVARSDSRLAATITPHHLMINRNHMLVGGIRPHYYCLPIAKRESHRQALVKAACSGDHRFFLGTDSAPHTRSSKESDCGCAGVFNAANTMVCLATVFEEQNALDKLESFTSTNGCRWYGLEPNKDTLTLRKSEVASPLPDQIVLSEDTVIPFDPARSVYWQVV